MTGVNLMQKNGSEKQKNKFYNGDFTLIKKLPVP